MCVKPTTRSKYDLSCSGAFPPAPFPLPAAGPGSPRVLANAHSSCPALPTARLLAGATHLGTPQLTPVEALLGKPPVDEEDKEEAAMEDRIVVLTMLSQLQEVGVLCFCCNPGCPVCCYRAARVLPPAKDAPLADKDAHLSQGKFSLKTLTAAARRVTL